MRECSVWTGTSVICIIIKQSSLSSSKIYLSLSLDAAGRWILKAQLLSAYPGDWESLWEENEDFWLPLRVSIPKGRRGFSELRAGYTEGMGWHFQELVSKSWGTQRREKKWEWGKQVRNPVKYDVLHTIDFRNKWSFCRVIFKSPYEFGQFGTALCGADSGCPGT